MVNGLKILLVEDNPDDAELLQYELKKSGLIFTLVIVQTKEAFENALHSFLPDVILSDYSLPSFDGVSAFRMKQNKFSHIPFIIVSGTIGEESSVELIKSGITDYALKGKLFTLPLKIARALEEVKEKQKKTKTELELIQSERRLARAQQIAHIGSWELDFTSNSVFCSEEACRIYGLEHDKNHVSFDTWVSFVHPEDVGFVLEKIKESKHSPHNISFYYRILLKNEQVRHIYSESRVELDASGLPTSLYGITHDVTKVKLAEEQLDFDRNNLTSLINNTKDLMWSVDKDFLFITSNKPFEKMVDLVFGKAIEKGNNALATTFTPEQLSRYKVYYERAFEGETFTEIEHLDYPIEIWSEISFYPIRKGDKVIGTACHSHDITIRKRAEINLEQQNIELVKVNAELDRFVYSASHELRAPIASLLGLVSLFEYDLMDESQLHKLYLMEKTIKKLDGFIQDIIHYSRNSRLDFDFDKIDFKQLISDSIEQLRYMEKASNAHILVDVIQEIDFYSDSKRIRIILNNLLSNAIKYQNSTKESQTITVTVRTFIDRADIKISDNGIGIAPEYHSKIFDMFFRLSGAVEGSGIGLYIVKEIIEKLEGSILVNSQEGSGTSFMVELKNAKPRKKKDRQQINALA